LRKGRFDEIFFVDLPAIDERKEIFAIHLSKRNREPGRFDIDTFASASEGYSGAEIEQAVISAMFAAFNRGSDLTNEDILAAINEGVPISVTMAEQIVALRVWAEKRARSAG
jgi:SpoVK/Ycf46/Vps4 family AAA+-type ATPase